MAHSQSFDYLLEGVGADTNGSDVTLATGKYMLIVSGTPGSAFELQINVRGTYTTVANSGLTAAGTVNLELPQGDYRAITGTGASACYASIARIGY